MSGELAVDLGTSRTRVMDGSLGAIVDEATLAAVELGSGRLLAFGEKAVRMRGRVAGEVEIVRPVRRGQLQDLGLTDQICAALISRARRSGGGRPAVLCSIPGASTSVQKRALEQSFRSAGARRVDFLGHAFAGGVASRLRLDEPVASMVMDVGAGVTDVAVIALGGIVTEASVPVGGDDFDLAVRELCLRSFDLVIDSGTAERVKRALGSAWPLEELKAEVHGRDSSSGAPRSVVLSRGEVAAVLVDRVDQIVAAAVSCITTAPPDLADDLLSRGLHLVGEGGFLDGFGRRLATAAGLPVHFAEEPARAAVSGAARCLGQAR
ncbi:MAG: rod shape-determining protein [Acidimicrobiales bacterium]